MKTHFVHCAWDDEAQVWYVAHSTVPGLATEAAEPGALLQKLRVLIPELLERLVRDARNTTRVISRKIRQAERFDLSGDTPRSTSTSRK